MSRKSPKKTPVAPKKTPPPNRPDDVAEIESEANVAFNRALAKRLAPHPKYPTQNAQSETPEQQEARERRLAYHYAASQRMLHPAALFNYVQEALTLWHRGGLREANLARLRDEVLLCARRLPFGPQHPHSNPRKSGDPADDLLELQNWLRGVPTKRAVRPISEERSAPMTLKEIAERYLGRTDVRPEKIKPILEKDHDLKRVAEGRNLWTVRIDTMDKATRDRMTRPDKK
jgi:hypothetical protein